jgi:hypothetical protein
MKIMFDLEEKGTRKKREKEGGLAKCKRQRQI